MANSYTLTEIADLCHNEIRLIGTLTEFAADAYVKNDVGVIKYKGVVNCNNAFINIKATTTSFDDTFSPFINEFNTSVVGHKVFIIGKLNNSGGINVDYIAMAYKEDYFEGEVTGIPYEVGRVLVLDNEGHSILNLDVYDEDDKDCMGQLAMISLSLNPIEVKDDVIISTNPYPIGWTAFVCKHLDEDISDIISQALEEHEIYIEAIQQMKEGR